MQHSIISSELQSKPAPDLPVALIVSPHFPPSTLAGVHRARHLAKHLPSHGWRPVIIRVDEEHYTEASDPGLADLLPPNLTQIRCAAFPATWSKYVGIGDVGIRAYGKIKAAIAEAVTTYQPKVVMITGSPFYPMLLSGWIKRSVGLPVLLDFQDPWVNNMGPSRPFLSKGRMAHRLSVALEPRAVMHANWISSVSEIQNEEMAQRYPELQAERMTAIPIGGDPDDFEALRSAPPANQSVHLESDKVNLCYVGTFLPRATPVVSALFQAVSEMVKAKPALKDKLRLVFVGTSNQPPRLGATAPKHLVSPIAASHGIQDIVVEHPERVPFLNALTLLANANGVLMIGSDEPHYTASKIYPGLMSGTPFLSLFHDQSSSQKILSKAGGGTSLSFQGIERIDELRPNIIEGIERLMTAPSTLGEADPDSYQRYTASYVSSAYADVFDRMMR